MIDDRPTLSHAYAMANGVKLHYVTAGSGPPLVLLHGWPSTWYHWRKVIPALAEHFTVIAPDLRGFGDSAKPLSGYDTRTVATDARELVRGLGIEEPVRVVGHDWGAVHAYTYAANFREEVSHLVYIDEPLPGFSYEQFASFTAETSREGGFWFAAFNCVPDLPEALVAGREKTLLWTLYRTMAYDIGAFEQQDMDEYARCFGHGGLRGSLGVYREVFTTAEQNRESAQVKLEIPVLALGGAFGMGELPLHEMQQVAVDVRGRVIERCGHFVAEERPEALVEELLGFLGPDRDTPAGDLAALRA